ncbi:MAG: hypothetical protein ACR2JB_30220 [Bryobacteraceae bacterium]
MSASTSSSARKQSGFAPIPLLWAAFQLTPICLKGGVVTVLSQAVHTAAVFLAKTRVPGARGEKKPPTIIIDVGKRLGPGKKLLQELVI